MVMLMNLMVLFILMLKKYNEDHDYGILSGRNIEEMIDGASSRDLDGSSDKKNGVDFALWKKADPEHIMRWPSPWGDGFLKLAFGMYGNEYKIS